MKIHFLKNLTQIKVPEGSPEWFRVFPVGKVEIKGEPPAYFDEESADIIMREFRAQGHDMVVDYEHQTLYTRENGQPAPAAGWFKQLQWRDDGLYATGVRWTGKAAAAIEAGEYRYLSPVLHYDPNSGEVLAVGNGKILEDGSKRDLDIKDASEYIPGHGGVQRDLELVRSQRAQLREILAGGN